MERAINLTGMYVHIPLHGVSHLVSLVEFEHRAVLLDAQEGR